MIHATFQRLLDSRGRLALTAATVMLGVMFLVAALVLTDSTRAALDQAYAQAYADADVIVRAPKGFSGGPNEPLPPVPAEAAEQLEPLPAVAAVEGRVQTMAQMIIASGEAVEAIAMAEPVDTTTSSMQLRSGTWPAGPSEVVVDAATARQLGLARGDTIQMLLPQGMSEARVSGTVGFGPLDGLAHGGRVVLDRATAIQQLATEGFGELAVIGKPGTSPAELAAAIESQVESVSVLTASSAAERDAAAAAGQTAVIGYILGGVALIGLLIGSFLIANTLRMLVAQRSRELAVLRAVGATRRQVATSVILEAAITGLVGAVAGTAAGVGIGALLTSTSGSLVPGLPPTAPTVTIMPIVVGPVVGIVVALVASRAAVRRALDVSPVAAMRALATTDQGPSRIRALLGVPVFALGLGLVTAGSALGVFALAAGGALAILGTGALFPFVVGPLLSALSRPLDRLGATGRLAREQTLASPARTGSTAAALAVALALVTFLLTFGASLGAASPSVLAERERAELTIRSDAPWGLHGFMADLAREVEAVPGVATSAAVAYGSFTLSIGDQAPRDAAFYAVDPSAVADLFHIDVVSGSLDDLEVDELALRENLADGAGLQLGDAVTATLPDGSATEFAIGAIFSGPLTTNWIAAPDAVEPFLADAGREVFVRLDPVADATVVRNAVEEVAAGYPATQVLDRAEKEAAMTDANASTLGILAALLSLAVLVGVLGIVNTLSLAIIERIREFGLLRAVGATQRQIRAVVRWEATLIATLGALLGTTFGIGLAWITTSAFSQFPMPFTIPVLPLAAAAAATVVLGIGAAILPARRAARIELLRALYTT